MNCLPSRVYLEKQEFLMSSSCRKDFKSFFQRCWAYGWLASADFSRFCAGKVTVTSTFSQGKAKCLFFKAFSQGLRVLCPFVLVKGRVWKIRCSYYWEAELTCCVNIIPGVAVAAPSRQGWCKAATCLGSGSPSAVHVSGVDSLHCEHIS